jgi:hypothetical protein
MALSDFNPLSYFTELDVFPRTVFGAGVLFLFVAVARGVAPVLLFVALGLIFIALAFHFFSHCVWSDPQEPYGSRLWAEGIVYLILCTLVAVFCFYVAQYTYFHKTLPSYLQPRTANTLTK